MEVAVPRGEGRRSGPKIPLPPRPSGRHYIHCATGGNHLFKVGRFLSEVIDKVPPAHEIHIIGISEAEAAGPSR